MFIIIYGLDEFALVFTLVLVQNWDRS